MKSPYDVATVPRHGEPSTEKKVRVRLSKEQAFFFTLDSGMKNAARRGINAIKDAPIKFHKRLMI